MEVKVGVLHSTARVILGQVLSILTCGSGTRAYGRNSLVEIIQRQTLGMRKQLQTHSFGVRNRACYRLCNCTPLECKEQLFIRKPSTGLNI